MSFDAGARVRSGGHPPGRIDDGVLDLIAAGSSDRGGRRAGNAWRALVGLLVCRCFRISERSIHTDESRE